MNSDAWRRLLRPLVPAYAGLVGTKQWLFEHGWPQQQHLRHPVISVGSLSVGGAGKTPLVIMLAELLGDRGFEVRILTRGYGRLSSAVERVQPYGDVKRFGDEPVMMARRLPGASVWVGADRYRAGMLAEAHESPGLRAIYLLDDGFQHRQLARDVDVVLLTRQDLQDSLLPPGNLREPLKAMRRADVVVLREDEGFAGGISGKAATWFVRRELRFDISEGVLERPVAFCGLARPAGFFAMLANSGTNVAAVSVFRDHHAYSAKDIEGLVDFAKLHGADGFVATEKDLVKLSEAMRERLRSVGALVVPKLVLELRDAEAKLEELIEVITRSTKIVG